MHKSSNSSGLLLAAQHSKAPPAECPTALTLLPPPFLAASSACEIIDFTKGCQFVVLLGTRWELYSMGIAERRLRMGL